jgi:hypothetical protein
MTLNSTTLNAIKTKVTNLMQQLLILVPLLITTLIAAPLARSAEPTSLDTLYSGQDITCPNWQCDIII